MTLQPGPILMLQGCNNLIYLSCMQYGKALNANPGWTWIKEYEDFANNPKKVQKAFKVPVAKTPKYKFGVEGTALHLACAMA